MNWIKEMLNEALNEAVKKENVNFNDDVQELSGKIAKLVADLPAPLAAGSCLDAFLRVVIESSFDREMAVDIVNQSHGGLLRNLDLVREEHWKREHA